MYCVVSLEIKRKTQKNEEKKYLRYFHAIRLSLTMRRKYSTTNYLYQQNAIAILRRIHTNAGFILNT